MWGLESAYKAVHRTGPPARAVHRGALRWNIGHSPSDDCHLSRRAPHHAAARCVVEWPVLLRRGAGVSCVHWSATLMTIFARFAVGLIAVSSEDSALLLLMLTVNSKLSNLHFLLVFYLSPRCWQRLRCRMLNLSSQMVYCLIPDASSHPIRRNRRQAWRQPNEAKSQGP